MPLAPLLSPTLSLRRFLAQLAFHDVVTVPSTSKSESKSYRPMTFASAASACWVPILVTSSDLGHAVDHAVTMFSVLMCMLPSETRSALSMDSLRDILGDVLDTHVGCAIHHTVGGVSCAKLLFVVHPVLLISRCQSTTGKLGMEENKPRWGRASWVRRAPRRDYGGYSRAGRRKNCVRSWPRFVSFSWNRGCSWSSDWHILSTVSGSPSATRARCCCWSETPARCVNLYKCSGIENSVLGAKNCWWRAREVRDTVLENMTTFCCVVYEITAVVCERCCGCESMGLCVV